MSAGQKTPFGLSINRHSAAKAQDAIQQLGKALPCSVVAIDDTVGGCIVTVKFEVITDFTLPNVTIPHAMGEWIRYPVMVGDKGVVIPCDSRLNDTSAIGKGKGDLIQPANLTALVFMPIGNAAWTPTPDINKTVIYGNDGVIIMNRRNGGVMMTIDDNGAHFNCPIYCNGKRIDETHKHIGVQTGSGQTGTVV